MLQVFSMAVNLPQADPTGFEPAISALTGPHVWPLHHGSAADYSLLHIQSSVKRIGIPW